MLASGWIASSLHAQPAWNFTGGNVNFDWEDTTKWTPASVPDAAGAVVTIKQNSTGTKNAKINSPHTVGSLSAGRGGGNAGRMWVFSVPGTLTLDNTGYSGKPYVGQDGTYGYQEYPMVLAGTQGVRFGGGGTMMVRGNNTFTGDVDLTASRIIINHTNALPHGTRPGNIAFVDLGNGYGTMDLTNNNITINGLSSPLGGGTITTTSSGTAILTVGDNDQGGDFGGVIQNGSGTLSLTKIGGGTLTLSGTNIHSGTTRILAGKLQMGAVGLISSSPISVGPGATFDLSLVAAPPYVINPGQTLEGSGATGSIEGSLSLDGGANLNLTYSAGTPTLNVTNGTLTLNANATTVNVTGSPIGDGSYKLISKSGTGLVAGTVGSVSVVGSGIVGGGTANLAISGGELYLNVTGGATVVQWGTGNGTWGNGIAGWNSGGTTAFANGNAALLTDTYSSGDPTITLSGEVSPQIVLVNSTKHYTLTGAGNIGGGCELRKLGTGTLTLNTANNYSGGSTLFQGTLDVKNAAALGLASGTFTINGGVLDNSSGTAVNLSDYPQSWNGDFAFAGASDLSLGAGLVTMGGSRTITVNSNTLSVGGVVLGSGMSLTKAGAGTLALDNALSLDTGALTVNGGRLALGGNNNFSGGVTINDGEVVVKNTGALDAGTPNNVTMPDTAPSKVLSLNGNSITIANLTQSGTGNPTAAVVQNGNPTNAATLRVSITGSITYVGLMVDGGAAPLAFTKMGGGTLTLGAGGVGTTNFAYTGDTIISGGTLALGANNCLPYGPGKGSVLIGASCTLDMVNRNVTLNGLYGAGKVTHSANNNGGVLSVGADGSGGNLTGPIQDGSAISPFVGLTKLGAGTQILSGANGYTGPTIVSGGTLLVNSPGSLKAGNLASVTVQANATLGGSGVIHPAVTNLAGSTIGAGENNAGTLTIGGGLDLSAGGTNVWEVSALYDDVDGQQGTNFDQILLTGGALTLGGASVLDLRFIGDATAPNASIPFWQSMHKWTIIAASGATSTFTTLVNGTYPAGSFTTAAEAGGIVLTFTPAGSGPTPVTTFGITSGPGNSLTLNYSGGTGSQFVLLQTNNVAAPQNLWTRVQTNPSPSSSFIIVPGTNGQNYYRVKSE